MHNCRMRVFSELSLVLLVSFFGCDRTTPKQQRFKELETVEVGAGQDAGLTTESDERARPVESQTGGVLPSDFPSDVPVFFPSSIVDFGQRGSGRSFVEVDTPVPLDEARSSLAAQLQRSGWSVEAIGDAGNTYSKGGRWIQLILTDLTSGTRIRYEY